ncbi:MAG: ABC transporter substrate-binding protein [Clostridia bacterium]|nr:ABC transporter substrate-binding protein [Clostridia bacterium]
MKKIRKIVVVLMALCLAAAMLAGCVTGTNDPAEEKKTQVRVLTLKGPTGLGMVQLMEKNANGTTANDYSFTVCGSPDEIKTEILAGRYDIAAVPVNLASVLYNKTEGALKIAAVNTLGVLYVLENGETINSVADLKGKTIGATGQGSTPEYVLNYILRANGLEPGVDVTVEYYAEHEELAKRLIGGLCDIGMLPQPNVTAVTTKKPEIRIALDLTEEWGKVDTTGSALTQGCVVVSKEFAENNEKALDDFLAEYRVSAEFANSDPATAGQYSAKFEVVPDAAVATAAIPKCNICCITGEEMKTKVSGMLSVLFSADPKSVGGKLPDEGIYYNK